VFNCIRDMNSIIKQLNKAVKTLDQHNIIKNGEYYCFRKKYKHSRIIWQQILKMNLFKKEIENASKQ